MEEYKVKLAERLKNERKRIGLSHDKLSKALLEKYGVNVSFDSLKNYEVTDTTSERFGKNFAMRIEYLYCLADYFEVSVDYLLGKTNDRSVDPNERTAVAYTGLNQEALQNISLKIKSEPLMAELLNYLFTDIVFGDCLDKLLDYYCFFKGDKLCDNLAREKCGELTFEEYKRARWALCNNPELSWRIKDILYAQHLQEADAEERDFSKYEADLQQIIRYQTAEAFNATLDRFKDL